MNIGIISAVFCKYRILIPNMQCMNSVQMQQFNVSVSKHLLQKFPLQSQYLTEIVILLAVFWVKGSPNLISSGLILRIILKCRFEMFFISSILFSYHKSIFNHFRDFISGILKV